MSFSISVLLILASQRIESVIKLSAESSGKMKNEVRGAPPTPIEWMIMCWVAGRFVSKIYEIFHYKKNHSPFITVLLILASQRIESLTMIAVTSDTNTSEKLKNEMRGAPPSEIEWMITFWVAGKMGMLWNSTGAHAAQLTVKLLDKHNKYIQC